MKVLILHQHFNTPKKGGAIRSYYLAKALVEKGIQVTVLTGHNDKYKRENYEGIDIHYLSVPYDNRFGFGARSSSFLKYILAIIRKQKLIADVDICYAISTPLTVGLAALWLKKTKGIKYIFEVGDLWPDAPIQLGFISNPVFKWFLYKVESLIYKQSESVVALSTSIKAAVEKKVNRKQVHLIPNMADVDFYSPSVKNLQLEEKFQVKDKFVVSYIGALGFANGLDYFLDCARASQKAALPVHFILCGDGAMLENLKTSAKRLMLQNLTIVPFQTRDGVRDIMNVTDASFICYKSVPVLETGSPNKYFDGMAAGKLIVVNFAGWIKDEIERHNFGVHVDPNHPTDFVKKISFFINNSKQLAEWQINARQHAISNYSRQILNDRFVSIFMNLPFIP
ncbi:MAG TPA: glycosyltransferase family 4 protein [Cyclobacteriaceae bacterium]|nr:glycosyltransferase family 4 protein [Cyclobacteriaceae bacterium]